MSVNVFCADCGGKPFNVNVLVATAMLYARSSMLCSSTPLIHNLPPEEAQPLFNAGLRPLTPTPPLRAKLAAIAGRRHRKSFSRDFTTKNTQRTAGMKFRGHDQHATAILMGEAFFYVARLIAGRHALDHANAD